MSINNLSNESPVKKLRMTELGRISRIILELEPLAHVYERHGTELFKVSVELLADYRALKSGLLENELSESNLSDVYRRTFTGTFVGDRKALLKVAADEGAR